MKAARAIVGAGALLVVAGLTPAAWGQEAKKPDLLFTLTETLHQTDNRLITRDDLRDPPAPPVDRLSEAIRVRVIVGDPQCLPGEPTYDGPGRSSRRSSAR